LKNKKNKKKKEEKKFAYLSEPFLFFDFLKLFPKLPSHLPYNHMRISQSFKKGIK
jgi:hypothetical protein